MRIFHILAVTSCVMSLCISSARAQDIRNQTEPHFPPVCAVVQAFLVATPSGPMIPSNAESQNKESREETHKIDAALQTCGAGKAVELALGPSQNDAFLINPIKLPVGTSLIVDGGVTVYASRNAAIYQNPDYSDVKCGSLQQGKQNEGCLPLIALGSHSGVYGYGVIDGQGNQYMLRGSQVLSKTWWDLETGKRCIGKNGQPTTNCLQEAPILIMGQGDNGALADDMTFYKITLRNPPFHNVWFAGTNVTAWGVKAQTPWTIGNTAGFVFHGQNILIRDTVIANGDQDIVVEPSSEMTSNVTIDHVTAYSRGGINVADLYTDGVQNVLIHDFNMTGDLPSVVGTTVNGVPESTLKQLFGLQSYTQALPNAASLYGLQITMLFGESKYKRQIKNVTFDSVCLQDIQRALYIGKGGAENNGDSTGFPDPSMEDVAFRDVHVLAPTSQFPALDHGIPTNPSQPGSYDLTFVADPANKFYNRFTLDNVVFDNRPSDTLTLGTIDAQGNVITAKSNVFPPILNALDTSPPPSGWTLKNNFYAERAPLVDPSLAHPCPRDLWPFLTGELYLSMGNKATGNDTNLASADVKAASAITLNAVLQPAMTQVTDFRPLGYGSYPGLVEVGSPPLRNPVFFLDNGWPIGVGSLRANGTLATLQIAHLSRGTHRFTALYSPDSIYKGYRFGEVTVRAQ